MPEYQLSVLNRWTQFVYDSRLKVLFVLCGVLLFSIIIIMLRIDHYQLMFSNLIIIVVWRFLLNFGHILYTIYSIASPHNLILPWRVRV